MMGTAVSGNEEIFRIRYLKGSYEFGLTGKYTMSLLTIIFKTLVPDWPIILDFKAARGVTNIIEMYTFTNLEPEQDLSQDPR
jgi:hypothetical protein